MVNTAQTLWIDFSLFSTQLKNLIWFDFKLFRLTFTAVQHWLHNKMSKNDVDFFEVFGVRCSTLRHANRENSNVKVFQIFRCKLKVSKGTFEYIFYILFVPFPIHSSELCETVGNIFSEIPFWKPIWISIEYESIANG